MQNNVMTAPVFSIKQANWCLFFVLLAYVAIDFLQLFLELFLGLDPGILFYIVAHMAAMLPAVIFAFSSRKRIQSLRFARTTVRNIVYSLLLAFFCYLLTSVLIAFLAELIMRAGGSIPGNAAAEYVTSGSVLFAVLFIVVLAPFTEEVLLRGIFQNAYEKRVGAYAVVVSGLVFGLMHADLLSIIYGMIAGLLLGTVYLKTRSLWCAIIFHALYNLLGYTLIADKYVLNLPWTIGLLPTVPGDVFNPVIFVYLLGIGVLSAAMIYLLLRFLNGANIRSGYNGVRAPREKYEMVPFILACVMLGFRAVLGTISYFVW